MLRPVLMLSMRPGPCSHPSRCSFFVPFDDVSLETEAEKKIRAKIVPPDAVVRRTVVKTIWQGTLESRVPWIGILYVIRIQWFVVALLLLYEKESKGEEKNEVSKQPMFWIMTSSTKIANKIDERERANKFGNPTKLFEDSKQFDAHNTQKKQKNVKRNHAR